MKQACSYVVKGDSLSHELSGTKAKTTYGEYHQQNDNNSFTKRKLSK